MRKVTSSSRALESVCQMYDPGIELKAVTFRGNKALKWYSNVFASISIANNLPAHFLVVENCTFQSGEANVSGIGISLTHTLENSVPGKFSARGTDLLSNPLENSVPRGTDFPSNLLGNSVPRGMDFPSNPLGNSVPGARIFPAICWETQCPNRLWKYLVMYG